MKTDELIDHIAVLPMARLSPRALLLRGLLIGLMASTALMLIWLGLRPDLDNAMLTTAFWLKLAFAAAVAAIVFPITLVLSRPTGAEEGRFWLLGLPFAALAGLAILQLGTASPDERMHLVFGHSAHVCSLYIAILSIPVLAGLLFAFRGLAPTRPIAAGLSAGFLAGALGTLVYAFHCDESAAPFVVVWYTLGMSVVGAMGGLLGRALLRW